MTACALNFFLSKYESDHPVHSTGLCAGSPASVRKNLEILTSQTAVSLQLLDAELSL